MITVLILTVISMISTPWHQGLHGKLIHIITIHSDPVAFQLADFRLITQRLCQESMLDRDQVYWLWVTLRLASLDFGFSEVILGYPLLTLNSNNFRFWGSTDKPNSALESQRNSKNLEWGGFCKKILLKICIEPLQFLIIFSVICNTFYHYFGSNRLYANFEQNFFAKTPPTPNF